MVSTRLQSGCATGSGSPAGVGSSSSPPHSSGNDYHAAGNRNGSSFEQIGSLSNFKVTSNATSVIVPPPASFSSLAPHAGNQLQTLGPAGIPGAAALLTPSSKTTGAVSIYKVPTGVLNLMQFPTELLEKILLFLDFRMISSLRLVNRRMNVVCGSTLSTTFNQLQSKIVARFSAIKSKMPRRESARRQHPLACESDIIEMLHMRLALLQMSFGKHIERQHCCFFAGEILDEIYRILHYIKTTPRLARPYKVTDELFDLSTMAMEYFKEKIEPTLPEITYFGTDFIDIAGPFPSSKIDAVGCGSDTGGCGFESTLELSPPRSPPQSNMVLRKRIHKIKQGMKRYSSQLTLMKRELKLCKVKLVDQTKTVVDYATRLDEYDKKNEETSRKFSSVLQELNKCKTELQFFRSKFPFNPDCTCSGPLVATEPSQTQQVLSPQAIHLPPSGGGVEAELPAPLEPADPASLLVAAIPLAGSASPRAAEEETLAAPMEAVVKKPGRLRASTSEAALPTTLPLAGGDGDAKESYHHSRKSGKRHASHATSQNSEDSSGGSDQEISVRKPRGYHSNDPALPSTSGDTSHRTKKRKSSTQHAPALRGASLPGAGTSGLCKRSRR